MDKRLQLDLKWHDNDALTICVTAWNRTFGGTADVYVATGGLREAAAQLEGFPHTPTDTREVTFGQFGPELAGGAVSMRFYCVGGAGHAYVESKMESGNHVAGVTQSTVLVLRIEPAGLDSFVEDLRRVEGEKMGNARLRAI